MKTLLLALGLLLCLPAVSAGQSGADLYKTLCASCHPVSGPPTAAPPIFAVKDHAVRAYPRREDFIDYIVNWVAHPDASRALMPGAVRRFGLMPAFPYPEQQVRQVAGFLYDSELRLPDWYQRHYEAEHGKPAQ